MNKKDFGTQIKHFRRIAGLTQQELAEKVGLHEKQISRIESGCHFPTFDNFVKIMEILDVEFSDFSSQSTKTTSKVKEKLQKLINNASEQDALLYLAIIENIKKYKD